MPRHLRIHAPGAFYHVTLRGNHRQYIFFAPADRCLFTDTVAEVISRFNARVHAYCLMTNHVHLLVQVGEAPLGRLMLRIASHYARTIQKRFATTGHLFERRYHAVLVDADAYLLELLRYIHLNPVRARMVAAVGDYAWSSHLTYRGVRSEPWLTIDFALAMFHSDPIHARALYQRFINENVAQSDASPLSYVNANDSRVLGNDRFLQSLSFTWQLRSKDTLPELIHAACLQFNVSSDALYSPSRQRQLTRVRAWIAHQAITKRVASLSEVARIFHRSEASLRESVKLHFNYP